MEGVYRCLKPKRNQNPWNFASQTWIYYVLSLGGHCNKFYCVKILVVVNKKMSGYACTYQVSTTQVKNVLVNCKLEIHKKIWLDPMPFTCHLIKFTNLVFDENAVLWPETICLDGLVEGFFLKMLLSQHSTKVGVQVQCIFKVYLSNQTTLSLTRNLLE